MNWNENKNIFVFDKKKPSTYLRYSSGSRYRTCTSQSRAADWSSDKINDSVVNGSVLNLTVVDDSREPITYNYYTQSSRSHLLTSGHLQQETRKMNWEKSCQPTTTTECLPRGRNTQKSLVRTCFFMWLTPFLWLIIVASLLSWTRQKSHQYVRLPADVLFSPPRENFPGNP